MTFKNLISFNLFLVSLLFNFAHANITYKLDEARNFLNGNTDLDEPNVEDWETHQHIEFTGQIDRELSGVEVYNLALKEY